MVPLVPASDCRPRLPPGGEEMFAAGARRRARVGNGRLALGAAVVSWVAGGEGHGHLARLLA